MWVTRLFALLKSGLGVFQDAIPAPMPGCRMNRGATTVTTPINSAGGSVGERPHSGPFTQSSSAAKVIPIA